MKESLGSGIGQVKPIPVSASADPRRPDVPNPEKDTNNMGYNLSWRVTRIKFGISGIEKAVLRAICDAVDEGDPNNICYPSIDQLVEQTEFSKRTVLRAIQSLEDNMILFRVPNYKWRRNGYRVDIDQVPQRHHTPKQNSARETPLKCQSGTIQGVTETPSKGPVKKQVKDKSVKVTNNLSLEGSWELVCSAIDTENVETLQSAWFDFMAHRKQLGVKMYTHQGLAVILRKVKDTADEHRVHACGILKASVEHSMSQNWKGIIISKFPEYAKSLPKRKLSNDEANAWCDEIKVRL